MNKSAHVQSGNYLIFILDILSPKPVQGTMEKIVILLRGRNVKAIPLRGGGNIFHTFHEKDLVNVYPSESVPCNVLF